MTALATIPLFQGRDFYVPRFELFLGDSSKRGAILFDVMQVTYKDNVESIDTFELTINNWDEVKRQFKHHDSSQLDPGQRVELHMGYLGDTGGLRTMMHGVITEMSPTFPAAGQPTLKVSGQNILHSFCKERRSEAYQANEATASKVARKICQRLGVEFPNDTSHPEIAHEHLIQENQFDIIFLMELARLEGYEIVIDEPSPTGPSKTTLKFVQSGDVLRAVYELRYGATLTEFTPTLSTAKQVSSITINGWDEAKGKRIKVEVGQQSLSGSQGLTKKLIPGSKNPVKDRKDVVSNLPVRDEQTAHAVATARLQSQNAKVVTGTGSVIGLPELRAGSQVYLWGLGQRFSGRYFVTGTTHTIGMSGYTTQFECQLEEVEPDPHAGKQT